MRWLHIWDTCAIHIVNNITTWSLGERKSGGSWRIRFQYISFIPSSFATAVSRPRIHIFRLLLRWWRAIFVRRHLWAIGRGSTSTTRSDSTGVSSISWTSFREAFLTLRTAALAAHCPSCTTRGGMVSVKALAADFGILVNIDCNGVSHWAFPSVPCLSRWMISAIGFQPRLINRVTVCCDDAEATRINKCAFVILVPSHYHSRAKKCTACLSFLFCDDGRGSQSVRRHVQYYSNSIDRLAVYQAKQKFKIYGLADFLISLENSKARSTPSRNRVANWTTKDAKE